MAELQNGLPPGWDCKRDERTGKLYYVNHFTKTTTWDDPRTSRNWHLHTPRHNQNASNECIPMQHGTPESRRNYVYPSRSSPLPAFQMSPKNLQEMSKPKMSPLSVRSPKVIDSSLTISTERIDETVAKVSGMFPTVTETHIRMLMKKYHAREALVISALQVEKYPITTPGPFATPPPQRNIHQPPPHHLVKSTGASPVCYRLPGGGSPASFRSSPRPHSSPKLKLRYMKSIFPAADETIILDILQNNENNIQKASDNLKDMGFERKDTVKEARQKVENKLEEERKEVEEEEKRKNVAAASIQSRVKTAEEKQKVKETLQGNYKDLAEHLISIALESVNFDEGKADQILQIIVQENTKTSDPEEKEEVDSNLPSTSGVANNNANMPISQSRQSLKSLLKAERDVEKHTFSRVVEENDVAYKSLNTTPTQGHNQDYAKGANEKLLLEEYVKWQGPNLSYRQGSNPSLLSKRTYKPCGPNKSLVKGHQCNLIKGSIFSRFNRAVVVED
ncbi:unnamed protein product [Phyllotreta striolata]|uniref:WW domain-containing protein n=1 Tax=Phyllotreta striolata TaxID=444603 RepID=A0A9N9TUS9_PHYSR|nr:unnamed protein product [Phyllotreta striolata]